MTGKSLGYHEKSKHVPYIYIPAAKQEHAHVAPHSFGEFSARD
jgi:hypothetical protein